MLTNLFGKRYDAATQQVLDDLMRESFSLLLPATALLIWGWLVVTVALSHSTRSHAYAVFGIAAISMLLAYRLQQQHLSLAIGIYLTGLLIGVTIVASVEGPTALYLYMPVMLITAALVSYRDAWGVTFISMVLVLVIGYLRRLAWQTDIVPPLALLLLTVLISWLSSQHLFTALAWTFNMTQQAQQKADEAREHRAEVQRVLKSLDQAYVRLERTNEALIVAQEAAEKAYRFKADFVANVSHELRTPLNLIAGFSEMMATAPESYGGVLLPSEYRGDVMAIYRSARHLRDLIDDVLDLSRIEAGNMPIAREPTDLADVAREACDMVRGLIEARGLQLDLILPDALPPLDLDRTRIRQVLLNLLTNASRFTDRGFIRLLIRTEEQTVVVTVEDSGRGINRYRLERAFEAFSQLEDGQASVGSGLGLAVSKRFVELHGGRIWIESVVGHGTKVNFTLPLPQTEFQSQSGHLNVTTLLRLHAGPPLVLVLHDDPRVLPLLRRHLTGFRFQLADTLDQARRDIQDMLPDIVVMDSAWSNRWAASASDLDLPAHLSLMTCSLPGSSYLGLIPGAVDYLSKPVTREDLTNALARLPVPPHTVLIVDDDPHIVRLFERMLKADNPKLYVLAALDGKAGLEAARTQHPDMMLLDLIMPETSGYDVLQEIANDEDLKGMQIIIVSAPLVESEAARLPGDWRLVRQEGFSLTEALTLLQSSLAAVTQPPATAPASAATLAADHPG